MCTKLGWTGYITNIEAAAEATNRYRYKRDLFY